MQHLEDLFEEKRKELPQYESDACINQFRYRLLNPANNGEPFRFRIGFVKSAQLFQLSDENFFRLRYESVPLQ